MTERRYTEGIWRFDGRSGFILVEKDGLLEALEKTQHFLVHTMHLPEWDNMVKGNATAIAKAKGQA